MRKVHFFKAYSRVGIHKLPHGQKEPADGVEEAPDYILTEAFLRDFASPKVSSFQFSIPQVLISRTHYKIIVNDTTNFRSLLNKKRDKSETQVVIGGDHCVTFASTLSDLDTFGTDIGFVHFDSHGDFNLYKESPSKNFHGMYIRALFDEFDLDRIEAISPKKIPTENFLFIGDLELDPGEITFFRKNNLKNIDHKDMDVNKEKSLKVVSGFVSRLKHIHVSFDVDVFEKNIAPATGTPSQAGFKKEPIFEILDVLREAKSLSLDICEVNPKKTGAKQTIELAQQVLLHFLQ